MNWYVISGNFYQQRGSDEDVQAFYTAVADLSTSRTTFRMWSELNQQQARPREKMKQCNQEDVHIVYCYDCRQVTWNNPAKSLLAGPQNQFGIDAVNRWMLLKLKQFSQQYKQGFR